MKKKRNGQGILYIRNLPPKIKIKFKARVKREGKTMECVVRELLTEYASGKKEMGYKDL